MIEAQPFQLVVANRTLPNAQALIASFDEQEAGVEAIQLDALHGAGQFDLVINATSAGLRAAIDGSNVASGRRLDPTAQPTI